MGGRELSFSKVAQLHTASIVKSLARLILKRNKRTSSFVNDEYNDGHWKSILDEKRWLKCQTLEQFLYSFESKNINCRIDNRYQHINNLEYYRLRNTELSSVLKSNFESTGEIVELGSGSGYNIFALAQLLPNTRLTGLDISINGVQAAREIAAYFKLGDRVRFDILDLTNASHPGFTLIAGKNCFSFFCLEQLPHAVEKVIRNLAAAKPARVLHIEPSTELLTWLRLSDWCNYIYIKSVNHQTELLTVLKVLAAEKSLNLLKVGEVSFAPIVHNRGFLGVWEPNSTRSAP